MLLDPDFGWHLKVGQYILSHGFLYKDLFSYTMPQYQFVYHEWFTEVIIAFLYPFIHLEGLTSIFAFVATGALFISFSFRKSLIVASLFLLGVVTLLPFVRINPQIVSWFFFALIVKISTQKTLWRKWRFIFPLIFLGWTNMHASFSLGIATFFLILLSRFFEEKKVVFTDILMFFLCLLATLCNPYGILLWKEVLIHLQSGLYNAIAEWQPSYFSPFLSYWVFVTCASVFTIRYWKRTKITEKILFISLIFLSVSALRQIPFFLLFALPILTGHISFFSKEANHASGGKKRLRVASTIFSVIILGFTFLQLWIDLREAFSFQESAYYPKKAVSYLTHHMPKGNIFSAYNWGGYLIWKLPQKKVFIDGRMPTWETQSATSSQSRNALKEYNDILSEKIPWKSTVEKYYIDTVLLPTQRAKGAYTFLEQLRRKKEVKNKDFLLELTMQHWRIVYIDSISMVLKPLKENY